MFGTYKALSTSRGSMSNEFWRGVVSAVLGAVVIGLLVLLITASA